MRTIKSIIAITAVGSAAIIAESCAKQSDQAIEFETRVDSIGYLMPDFQGDSLYFAAKYSVVWPEKIGREDFEVLRDTLLQLTFGHCRATTFDEASRIFMTSGIKAYEQEGDSSIVHVRVPFTTAYDAINNNVRLVGSDVTLLTPKVLVVQVNTYDYAYGSAHGMNMTRYLNYSLVDHCLLTAENIFKPGSSTAILDLINASAKEHYPDEGTLFPQPISGLGSIQITEDDIVFVYQPYEVAPYSTGVVNIPVSKYDLYRFMTPEASEAMSDD